LWADGVVSSILPMRTPLLAIALMAACVPGPGVLALPPPGALTLMWTAVTPFSFAISMA